MMTPIFLNPPNTQYFNLNQEHQEDQQQQLIVTSSPFCQPIGNINSSTSSNLHLDQGLMMSSNHSMTDQSHAFNDQLEALKNVFFDGESLSYGAQAVNSTDNYGSHQNHDLFIFKQQEDQEQNNLNGGGGGVSTDNNGSSLRWMSSKIRMMRKMINSNGPKTDPRGGSRIISSSNSSDQTAPNNNNNNNNVIRTCSDCNTTRTPLWRSGPQGPKSLCNACGIRQRKARKAAMEAAAAAAATNTRCTEDSSSTSTKTTIKLMINKDKKKPRGSNTCVSQHSNKKQTPCKEQANQLPDSDHSNTSSSSKQQLRFEEFAVDLLSKNAAFHRMFPRDEEEGALLLMALSYGLIQS